MEKQNKKAFTKREWIQLIITLTIVQAFFWYAVFENSQSASALGYVSFAGTLVSIILAVLAIGYTYGESISQKNKSDGLANQISTLGSLIESVELEAKSLEKIQDIANELSKFIGSYKADKDTSEKHLKHIRENLSNFTKMSSSPISNDTGPQRPIDKLINSNRSPLDEACYLLLVYVEKNQDGEGFDVIDVSLDEFLPDTPMNLSSEFFLGALYTQYSLLLSYGFIQEEVEDGPFKIDPDLREFIVNEMPTNRGNNSNSYNEFLHELKRMVKAS
ncbi:MULTISPECIES: hypothetical protein [unclassified Pseudoalteromonas]|uniref:hypothetical protein n=1 Tax=unclassified Pseudoalteromonas TaxID=194690 RepID=UPI00110AE31A|nr:MULTISPECIES: hypothetical protein [unclassified Pseudoalteromonas]TMP45906.1 hypothetical protein CWB80_11505 [Pseudoalteromonas sp. S1650]TMP66447.1 hypothetical protein CWB79_13135 [Pseudoalteromonas sp. S1649]